MSGFRQDEAYARGLDGEDRLAPLRQRFHLPPGPGDTPKAYLCGNSLGLLPVAAREAVERELDDWARLAVDAHFEGARPWFNYHEGFRDGTARIVGALPGEVVVMNGLSVNLHLMLVSFYRPTAGRHRILMEATAFPSDTYAVRSQIRFHGLDPEASLLVVPHGESIEAALERHGREVALVLVGGVNYFTGEAFDLARIAEQARRQGAVVGYDLAHAAGNIPLALHDWDVDFAVWCSYKYLNGGPGAVAGCFVHQRHARRPDLPRFAGWWGNVPASRFRMHLEPEFVPAAGADGWQLSNPPILALAPLSASLALFDEAGMPALLAKSLRLTAYLEAFIDHVGDPRIEVLTPRAPAARGCQLSLAVRDGGRRLFERLRSAGVVVDYREPDVVRAAPVPLYNSFQDVWRFGRALADWARD